MSEGGPSLVMVPFVTQHINRVLVEGNNRPDLELHPASFETLACPVHSLNIHTLSTPIKLQFIILL